MKILFAVENDEYGPAMASWIINHHWPESTQVRVLNVISWQPPDCELVYSLTLANYIEKQHQLARELTSSISSIIKSGKPELVVETEVLQGSPADSIISTANAWGADMIVVGSHSKKGFSLFMLGSVSAAVVSHAHCSVMVIRPNMVLKQKPEMSISKK